ncbi:MAG: metalloregulator ArsR/SmtB family transcription factor [Acidobacteriota bacterium]
MPARSSSKSVSDRFAAFSDPTRLRILHLLRDGELCVGDLVATLGLPQSTTSRHLAYLRRSSLVETRKSGLWTYYSLAPAKSDFHRKLLDCLTDRLLRRRTGPQERRDAREEGP